MMVSGGTTKDSLSKTKVDPFEVCGLKVKDNSVLCVQCRKWIYGRYAGVKRVTTKCSRNFGSRRHERNIGEAVEQEEALCDGVEAVREFACVGHRVSVVGGCEAAVPGAVLKSSVERPIFRIW